MRITPSPAQEASDHAWYRRAMVALHRSGIAEPTMLVDLDRLDANIDALRRHSRAGMAWRLVQKSIPSMALLEHIASRLDCQRLMIFHRPWLNLYAHQPAWHDVMLGKPMPAAAMRTYYECLAASPASETGGSNQPHWLIDTLQRLQQYLAVAQAGPDGLSHPLHHTVRQPLRICIEIDVGLHRGGVSTPAALDPLLSLIAKRPGHLQFTGLMGYDAHAAKAPLWRSQKQEMQAVQQRYRAFMTRIQTHHVALWHDRLIFNGAGSPTVTLHQPQSPVNDMAVGSALLKPTDFDLPSLTDFCPALLLAVPVLKTTTDMKLPFVAPVSRWLGRVLPGYAQTVALYGGRHMAKPVWPPGMRPMPLLGQSTNQAMMAMPASPRMQADDWTLWRPTQSEHALLQHGDLLGLRGDAIVGRFAIDSISHSPAGLGPRLSPLV